MLILATLMTLATNAPAQRLEAKYGEAQRPRIERGLQQVAEFWRPEDGNQAAFDRFVEANFAGDQKSLDELFDRMQFAMESIYGYMHEISRDLRRQTDLDIGSVYPFDEVMAGYEPSAHLNDDLFANKLAFVVLLNFPLPTLQEKLTEGDRWTRRQWAEVRLAESFSHRIPADAQQKLATARSQADRYVATYNIWMHH